MNEEGIFSKLIIDDKGDVYLLFADPMQPKIEIFETIIPI